MFLQEAKAKENYTVYRILPYNTEKHLLTDTKSITKAFNVKYYSKCNLVFPLLTQIPGFLWKSRMDLAPLSQLKIKPKYVLVNAYRMGIKQGI